jgi:hypothetical protein
VGFTQRLPSLGTGCVSRQHRTTSTVVNATAAVAGSVLAVGTIATYSEEAGPLSDGAILLGAGLAIAGMIGLVRTANLDPVEPDPAPVATPTRRPGPSLSPLPDADASPQAVNLARQARVLAAVGNCGAARMTARRLAAVDRAYHDRVVTRDPALDACR